MIVINEYLLNVYWVFDIILGFFFKRDFVEGR